MIQHVTSGNLSKPPEIDSTTQERMKNSRGNFQVRGLTDA